MADTTTTSAAAAGGGFSGLSGSTDDLRRVMDKLGARQEGNEVVVDLPADVLFDFNKAAIRPDAAATLEQVLELLRAQPGQGAIRIIGHTDAVASEAYNQTLSELRAASVRQWLIEQQVTGARITTEGLGERQPRAANTKPDGSDNPAGRQQNRRVQLRIARS